jgi:hypothetical protein
VIVYNRLVKTNNPKENCSSQQQFCVVIHSFFSIISKTVPVLVLVHEELFETEV